RRARRAAGLQRGVPDRAPRAPRSLLRRRPRARVGRLLRRAAGWRVLRVPQDRPALVGPFDKLRARLAVVANGGVPDQERANRLRAGRRFRAWRRRVRALLLRARSGRARRRARIDERTVQPRGGGGTA